MKILKIGMLVAVVLACNTGIASAAFITGGMGIIGNYDADATTLTLNTAIGTSGLDDIGATVGFGTGGFINNGSISLATFVPVTDVFTIGGWQLDLTSLTIVDQTVSLLTLKGTGLLSGNGFSSAAATWTFSSQGASSYSMSITAVPVPAAMWLFGSGLIGLIAVARKKA